MSNILAIDIGTSKITALVARLQKSELEIMGSGIAKSQGTRKGTIVNIELASSVIKSVVADAFHQAGVELDHAIVSVSGAYVKSVNSYGIANIPTKEITIKDVNRAMQTALYNANIPADYETLHALPYNFKVDDQTNIQDPVGMSGSRLEASVHIVIAQKSGLENLRRTVRSAGIEIDTMVLSGYAASIAVLQDEEKDLGVCVIDMGAGTSELVIHHGNALRYNDFLPVGGANVTSDLSMALHTPPKAAEQIKIEHGDLLGSRSGHLEISKTGSDGSTQQVQLETVINVITARIDETLMILARQLEKSGFKNSLGSGVIITGGAARHSGLQELASPIFGNIPVRVAKPRAISGLLDSLKDPAFSVPLGLIRYGAGEYTLYEIDSNKELKARFRNTHKIAQEVAEEDLPASIKEVATYPKQDQAHKAEEKSTIADIMVSRVEQGEPKHFFARFWNWLTKIF